MCCQPQLRLCTIPRGHAMLCAGHSPVACGGPRIGASSAQRYGANVSVVPVLAAQQRLRYKDRMRCSLSVPPPPSALRVCREYVSDASPSLPDSGEALRVLCFGWPVGVTLGFLVGSRCHGISERAPGACDTATVLLAVATAALPCRESLAASRPRRALRHFCISKSAAEAPDAELDTVAAPCTTPSVGGGGGGRGAVSRSD